MKKKIFSLIIIFLCVFSIINVNASTNTRERTEDNLLVPDYITVNDYNINNVLSTPSVDASEKVYDFADLYNDEEELEIYNKISEFITSTDMDMAVVTIDVNDKHSAMVYADDFYDYNEFGIGESHSGLLFLVDMDTREIYMSTSGDAISIYTDSRIDNILDSIFSYFSSKSYAYGTERFIDLALSYSKINSSDDSGYRITDNGELVRDYRGVYSVFIIALVVTIISLLVMASMNKMVHKANSAVSYLKKGTKNVTKINEVFLGSHVSKVRIDTDSGSIGGSHGGGSSTHTSSSGSSHGGGGHSF